MNLRLTTVHENENPALSPLGERVARDGAFISRRGTGEGVVTVTTFRPFSLQRGISF